MKKTLAALALAAAITTGSATDNQPQPQRFTVDAIYQAHVKSGNLGQIRGIGVGVGITYWLNENIGGSVAVVGDERLGELIDSAQAGIKLRYPIGRAAPYAFADVRRDFEGSDFSYVVGGGLAVSLTDRLSVFGQAGHEFDSRNRSGILTSVGVSLGF